jgi:hypothetical protein
MSMECYRVFNEREAWIIANDLRTLVYGEAELHQSALPTNPIHTVLQYATYKVHASRQLSQYSDYTAGLDRYRSIDWGRGHTAPRPIAAGPLCAAFSSARHLQRRSTSSDMRDLC